MRATLEQRFLPGATSRSISRSGPAGIPTLPAPQERIRTRSPMTVGRPSDDASFPFSAGIFPGRPWCTTALAVALRPAASQMAPRRRSRGQGPRTVQSLPRPAWRVGSGPKAVP